MKLDLEPSTERSARHVERRLARALARRCRRRTLWLGATWPTVEHELRAQGVSLHAEPRAPGAARDESYDTVLLARALEGRPEEHHAGMIDAAWSRVGADGRLLVCVPHEPDFTRRGLKRLLQRIDRPHLIKDQPLRWIAMYVDARPRLDRATRERHRVIAELCRGSVLELGCNYGHLCDAIRRRGHAVEGLDKSGLKVGRARGLFPEISFRQADILELAPQPRFDTVVLSEVLEHVPAAVGDRMLDRAWAAVASGGRLIVSVPNEDCVPHPNHLREFCRDDLARILGRYGEPWPVDEQPFKWLLMYVDRP